VETVTWPAGQRLSAAIRPLKFHAIMSLAVVPVLKITLCLSFKAMIAASTLPTSCNRFNAFLVLTTGSNLDTQHCICIVLCSRSQH
jgi:hypothetical protein